MHSGDIYLFLVAAAFAVLGIVLGGAGLRRAGTCRFRRQPQGVGLSERELEVLH
jgi:hypothetical protein